MINVRGVDLNLLVSLDVLLETRNVTHAAERLGVSQPAMSAQLSRLRVLFDDPLLVPAEGGRGMVATARASALGPGLRAAIDGLEKVVRDKPHFDPWADGRSFRIAATDNAVVRLGLPLAQQVAREAGAGVRLAFLAVDASLIAHQMETGAIDLLLGSRRMVPPAMKARELVKERFLLAQRKGHPRGATPPDLDEYCQLRHVLVSIAGGGFHGLMDEQLERLGRRRTVALSVQQFTLVPEILRTTDYVSALPSGLIARFAHALDAFELPFASEGFALLMAWHPRNHNDPSNRWLRKVLRTC